MKKIIKSLWKKKVHLIKRRNAGYSPKWYECENGFISIKKGKNKGFVVDLEDR